MQFAFSHRPGNAHFAVSFVPCAWHSQDLAEFGVDSLVAELRLSAFAARKIIAARDAFLAVA